jgi:hypothetical protein
MVATRTFWRRRQFLNATVFFLRFSAQLLRREELLARPLTVWKVEAELQVWGSCRPLHLSLRRTAGSSWTRVQAWETRPLCLPEAHIAEGRRRKPAPLTGCDETVIRRRPGGVRLGMEMEKRERRMGHGGRGLDDVLHG